MAAISLPGIPTGWAICGTFTQGSIPRNLGLKDLNPVGIQAWSATFRALQHANGRARCKILTRAGLRELKRRERRAPQNGSTSRVVLMGRDCRINGASARWLPGY
jgi:hypothetical protein